MTAYKTIEVRTADALEAPSDGGRARRILVPVVIEGSGNVLTYAYWENHRGYHFTLAGEPQHPGVTDVTFYDLWQSPLEWDRLSHYPWNLAPAHRNAEYQRRVQALLAAKDPIVAKAAERLAARPKCPKCGTRLSPPFPTSENLWCPACWEYWPSSLQEDQERDREQFYEIQAENAWLRDAEYDEESQRDLENDHFIEDLEAARADFDRQQRLEAERGHCPPDTTCDVCAAASYCVRTRG